MTQNVQITSPGNALASEVKRAGKPRTSNRGALDHMHIEPASNGVMVTSHYEPKNAKGEYPEPDRAVFGDHASAMQHIGAALAPHFEAPSPATE